MNRNEVLLLALLASLLLVAGIEGVCAVRVKDSQDAANQPSENAAQTSQNEDKCTPQYNASVGDTQLVEDPCSCNAFYVIKDGLVLRQVCQDSYHYDTDLRNCVRDEGDFSCDKSLY
eukprot:TRINITY_DN0_c2261_g1_i3.p1 TRINITY_DN0_c2261_g1~~TRINITY_DN0_c2261_g1_i3.p1  ORF type:complete len:117 (+),score=20.67 TRINITY_DN0_c2261_g1_i3:66-416(+)